MIRYNNKIFQHIPKTAGTAFKRLVSFHPNKLEYVDVHASISILDTC
jgi:hypothetical protein